MDHVQLVPTQSVISIFTKSERPSVVRGELVALLEAVLVRGAEEDAHTIIP